MAHLAAYMLPTRAQPWRSLFAEYQGGVSLCASVAGVTRCQRFIKKLVSMRGIQVFEWSGSDA